MKIDDIESKKLLPNWAHDADWIQAAFDQIVQIGVGRLPAIDAPLTMQAIQCLTDEELREWYARFGVVEYYPDLNRETREKMLYWIARLYRFLGTPHAIRVLCDYIYNDLPLDVTVIDNLAFEGETLVDPALLDLFDVEIDAGSSGISPANAYRLVSNIMRIARNSQTLRKIIYDYASDIDAPCAPCAYGSAVSVMVSDNDELASVVTPPGPTLPTVVKLNTLYNTWGTVNAGGVRTLRTTASTSGPTLDYDNSLTYAVWYYRPSGSAVYGDLSKVSIVSNNGYVAITATESVQAYYIGVYTCNSLDATIIMVYDSSNVAYNSFKYTASGTDYYYVLDGTQTDWTDDLASIGYRLDMQFYFYFKMSDYSPLDETFDYPSNNNYWTLRVRDQTDADFLSALGLRVNVSYQDGPFGFLKYDTSIYSYELKAVILPDGSDAAFNLSDFYITTHSNNLAAELWCNSSYSTPVRSCLISIKPIS